MSNFAKQNWAGFSGLNYFNSCLIKVFSSVKTGQVLGRVNMVSGHVKTQLIAHDKEVTKRKMCMETFYRRHKH